jgi:hypothetical protein
MSDWIDVTQEQIDHFAWATGDDQCGTISMGQAAGAPRHFERNRGWTPSLWRLS